MQDGQSTRISDQTNNYWFEFLENWLHTWFLENSRSLISNTKRYYYSSESEKEFLNDSCEKVLLGLHRNENGNSTRITHNVKFDLCVCEQIVHSNVPSIIILVS